MENPGPIDPHRKSELTSQNASDIVSGGAGKDDESASAVAKEQLARANPKEAAEGPPLAERRIAPVGEMITHAPEQTDVEFLRLIKSKVFEEGDLNLTDDQLMKFSEIDMKYNKNLNDVPFEEREIYNILVHLYKNVNFNELMIASEKKINDLNKIEANRTYVRNLPKDHNPNRSTIFLIAQMYEEQTLEKYSTYKTSQLLKDELTTFINSTLYLASVFQMAYCNENLSDNLFELSKFQALPLAQDLKFALRKQLDTILSLSVKLQSQFDEDLILLEKANFNNCTIDELLEIAAISSRYNYNSYPEGSYLKIKKLINLRAKNAPVNNFHSDALQNLVTDADSKKVIKLVQALKRSLDYEYFESNDSYDQFEIEAAERLFKPTEGAQAISQKNFADEELGIKSGDANYCCGSISVAALIDRMGENKKTIEDLLKEGVVRHLKLPPKQMSTLSTVEMLAAVNPEISKKPSIQEDWESKRNISIDRYEQFLGTIAPGSSGLLLADTAFIMYASNEDGSVEIFDSHGSSVPLIVGYTQPAYRAFFQNVNDAAAYLSVHRNLVPDCVLSFSPLEVKT